MRAAYQNRVSILLLVLLIVVSLLYCKYPLEVRLKAHSRPETGVAALDDGNTIQNVEANRSRVRNGERVRGDDDEIHKLGDGFFGIKPAREDEDWGKKECPVHELVDVEDFYNYIYHRPLKCDRAVLVGGQRKSHPPHLEGAKWVCMSKDINLVPRKCLVYSFGIAWDFTFDDEMDHKFECEVHSFDPTIGMKSKQRTQRATFHHLGLSNVSSPNDPKMKVERYANILSQLGHTNATLDYLKIDIEGYETNFFRDVFSNYPNLLKNVKQIGMEVHPMKGVMTPHQVELYRYFQQLECYGFQLWNSERNPIEGNIFQVNGHLRSCCYELVWARDKVW